MVAIVNMAADLGKRLLAEVEEVGLDEVGHMSNPKNRNIEVKLINPISRY